MRSTGLRKQTGSGRAEGCNCGYGIWSGMTGARHAALGRELKMNRKVHAVSCGGGTRQLCEVMALKGSAGVWASWPRYGAVVRLLAGLKPDFHDA